MRSNFSHLEELIGGYFHQDWKTYASTAAAVLERYLNEWPAEDIPKVAKELLAVLAQSDQAIDATMNLMECGYWPAGDGMSYRDWLTQMARRLAK